MTTTPHQPKSDGRVHGAIIGIRHPKQNKWLIIQRGENVALAPLKLAFPGGGIEPGESAQQTAIREAKEEVGLTIQTDSCVWEWLSPTRPLKLFGFLGHWSNDLQEIKHHPREVEQTMWLSTQEIQQQVSTGSALPGSELFAQALDAQLHTNQAAFNNQSIRSI